MSLPVPTSDALAASHALQQQIAAEIAAHDGAISFSRYMELALYAPGLGYYSGGSAKLGKDGDFTTAPELTPLFGAALAHAAAAIIAQTAPQILEFGAGTGQLAFDVLSEMAQLGIRIERYVIVELSGELRGRQQDKLRDFAQVEWLDALPESFEGVVLGNEVLDAMPVELVIRHPEGWQELKVTVKDGRFDYLPVPASAAVLAQIARQIPEHDSLPVGYVTEVHSVACAFMTTLSQMLTRGRGGAALLFDYGFPGHEYYFFQRATGTLMCHYRHHAHPDPFYYPGLQDITAHVDFTAMALAAQDAGAEVLGYLNQAGFLIAVGASDLLLRTDPADSLRYLPQARALQKLLSPAEMGELFKVLLIGHAVSLPETLLAQDRSHRL